MYRNPAPGCLSPLAILSTTLTLVVLLVLLPLIATREFSRTLGPGVLRGILAGKSKV